MPVFAATPRIYERAYKPRVLDNAGVIEAIMNWPGLYETEDGEQFKGSPVSEVPRRLLDVGWRNVSHLDDEHEMTRLGLRVVTARYVGGARAKRFCRVVVAMTAEHFTHDAHVRAWRQR
jgi:hypothetical protein